MGFVPVSEVHWVESRPRSKVPSGSQGYSFRTTKGADEEEGQEAGAIPTIPVAVSP